MATILRMPAVLANATEAVLASWTVAEGVPFKTGDALAEIETEKALVDLAAEEDGILGRHLVRSGDAITVGAPIAVLIGAGETDADIDAALGDHAAAAAPALTAAADTATHPAAVPGAPAAIDQAAPPTANVVDTSAPTRLFASPLARRLLKERGLSIDAVVGTGPGGRIVRRDVDVALAQQKSSVSDEEGVPALTGAPAPETVRAGGQSGEVLGYTAIPHTGMRRAIARRLTESKSTVPHFYLTSDCRVDDLLSLRAQINKTSSVKISINDLVVKAVAGAFRDVPDANVTWTDSELRRYDNVDIAVAVATEGGLLTPVIRGVNHLSLSDISARIVELAGRARAGRLRQEELEGGSFAVTNLGMYGTSEFSAILNPPQSGILAVGAALQQAVVTDGELAVATIMRCTLSVDHRAVDGALAAQWLSAFTARIEHPLAILV